MPHGPNRPAAVALAALAFASVLLGGCASNQTPAATTATAPADLTLMTPQQKASQIASSFPVQVPVPVGEVKRGEAQGDSAWVYEVVVPGDPSAVARWYATAYGNAEWTVTAVTATTLELQKNSAQTRLRFESVGDAGSPKTQVTAAVGVGTPVLQTQ